MDGYKKISPEEIHGNVFREIGTNWMLITATDDAGAYNTMTASWGGAGILWNAPVCFIFVRPQRYTYSFTESGDIVSLSFFGAGERRALGICGSKSGRDTDKIGEAGLTVIKTDEGATAFTEAELILSCRKLYADDLKEACFFDAAALSNYPEHDFHRMYICKIESAYIKN